MREAALRASDDERKFLTWQAQRLESVADRLLEASERKLG